MGDSFLVMMGYLILGLVALYVGARVITAAYFKSKQQFEGSKR